MNSFESQAGMIRVLIEKSIGRSSLALHWLGQLLECPAEARCGTRIHNSFGPISSEQPSRYSARASSAKTASWLSELAKASVHRRSDASSSRIHAPRDCCSSSGNLEASENASSSSRIIVVHPLSLLQSFDCLIKYEPRQVSLHHRLPARLRLCGLRP